jgi:hypothetical protein
MSISRLQLAYEILANEGVEYVADVGRALRQVMLSTAVERRFCRAICDL